MNGELIREARAWLNRFQNLREGGYSRDFALAWTGGSYGVLDGGESISAEDLITHLTDALERSEKFEHDRLRAELEREKADVWRWIYDQGEP